MAFPTLESFTNSTQDSNSASFNFSLPATVNSGDLLLAMIGNNGGDENMAVSGWTQINHQAAGASLFALDATGSEGGGTAAASWDSNERAAFSVARITGWSGDIADIESSFAFGPASSFTCPTLTPSHGSDEYLWILFRSVATSANTVTTWPTNYVDNQTRVISSGGAAASQGGIDFATRELEASSDAPGTWTFSSNWGTANGAYLVAIRPDQGGGPVAQDFPFRRYYQGGLAL